MMDLVVEASDRAPLAMMFAAAWSVAAMVRLAIFRGGVTHSRGVWWTLPLLWWCVELILHYPLDVDDPSAGLIVVVGISHLLSLVLISTLMLPGVVIALFRGCRSVKADAIWALGVGASVASVLLSYARWTAWAVLSM